MQFILYIVEKMNAHRNNIPILSNEEIIRYSRHLLLPQIGMSGQEKLKGSSVLLVGAGGLGSPLAMYLTAAGVGRIGMIDFDRVDLSNLQRQILYTTSDVGRKKLASAAEKLAALNPFVALELHSERLTTGNAFEIIAKYDVIADGTDNFPTRYLVNDACILLDKPNVFGSVNQFEGRVSVFSKGRGPCYRCLFPTPPAPGQAPSCAEAGVLGVVPGLIGTLQATEVIKILTGIGKPLTGRLLMVDALEMSFDEISISKNPDCPVCGDSPKITELIDYEEFCSVSPRQNREPSFSSGPTGLFPREQVTPLALKEALDKDQEIIILDVREAHERQICGIEHSLAIPLEDILARKDEIDDSTSIVVICKRGEQSQVAVDLLKSIGFTKTYNLAGGLERWAREVDPDMPRY